jgi:hypothetical protein
MVFKPGQSGNPTGIQGPRDRPVREAMRMEVAAAELGDLPVLKPNTLRAMARVQIEKAMAGDSAAFNIVADRLEGKPLQTHEGEDGEQLDGIKVIWLTGLNSGMYMSRMGSASHSEHYTNGHSAGLLSSPIVEPEKP